ncbi:MAG TPA: response regulator [Rhodospirillales bacterium]|nr:response regulator [Rhodospirillales bacterium]
MSTPASVLAGRRILLVEDEFIVAAMLEDILTGLGAVVVGPAYRLGEGLRLAEEEAIDVAILDVNIEGERSDAIADALAARSIPFVLATGYGDGEGRHGAQVLTKPYTPQMLTAALARAVEGGR